MTGEARAGSFRTTHARIDPAAGTVLETLDDRTYTWDEMFNKTQRKDVRFADYQPISTSMTPPIG